MISNRTVGWGDVGKMGWSKEGTGRGIQSLIRKVPDSLSVKTNGQAQGNHLCTSFLPRVRDREVRGAAGYLRVQERGSFPDVSLQGSRFIWVGPLEDLLLIIKVLLNR